MAFPPDESKLVSIFVQSILYGAYSVLFFTTTWMILSRAPLQRTMMGISLLMFVVATMHVAVNFTRIIKAFIIFAGATGGPAAFFNQLAEFTQMFGSTLYVIQTLVGDALVLYRCYLVWERKLWVIAFPFALLLGSTATGIGILWAFDKVGRAEIFAEELSHWITSFFSMTFATNVICTALVAYRVWAINRKHVSFRGRKLRSLMLLIVESGAIYSATLMVLLILYNVDSWFQYVVLDAVSPIVGIVFSVIILRIALGISTEDGETALIGAEDIRMSRMPSTGSNHKVHTFDHDAV
ncbi:hypothetical protein DFH09DRAFT_1031478 [Mycena vulgaris]|nr:hypothetical protein DFH09DRAFT_1031478 [Mycena vulgaris]